jgi:hypothetical protein
MRKLATQAELRIAEFFCELFAAIGIWKNCGKAVFIITPSSCEISRKPSILKFSICHRIAGRSAFRVDVMRPKITVKNSA